MPTTPPPPPAPGAASAATGTHDDNPPATAPPADPGASAPAPPAQPGRRPPEDTAAAAVTLPRLVQIRRGVRTALALGLAASLAANVLHAEANLVSRLIAAWPPAALAITVELVSRVPAASTGLSALRIAGTAAVAGIAAWVSYWHMAAVAARYGEDSTSAHLIPLSVDGLVVVASVCLVEIGRHTRALQPQGAPAAPAAAPAPAPAAPQVQPAPPLPPVGERRHALAELLARLPAGDPRSASELAADLGPRVGLRSSTARKYIGALRNGNAAPG